MRTALERGAQGRIEVHMKYIWLVLILAPACSDDPVPGPVYSAHSTTGGSASSTGTGVVTNDDCKPVSWRCCADGVETEPVCKNGALTCLEGQATSEEGACRVLASGAGGVGGVPGTGGLGGAGGGIASTVGSGGVGVGGAGGQGVCDEVACDAQCLLGLQCGTCVAGACVCGPC